MKQIITAMVGGILLFGCNSAPTEQNLVSSKLQRDLNPNVSEDELKQLVTDNNKFAFSLFQNLDDGKNNIFFSPVSISHALMMTYAGAAGETKDEMKTALNLTLDDTRVHEAFNKLDLTLNTSDERHIFKIANSIWPSLDFEFEKSYLDTIMVNYGASLKILDYTSKPEQSRQTINKWVEDKTEQKIKELIPKGSITPMTKMVLSNATYFKAGWENPFDENNTEKGVFNDTFETNFMYQTEVFDYFEDSSLQAVKLNYETGKSSMVILLPKNNTLPAITQNYINTIDNGFTRYRVTLKMPKFKFTSNSLSLVQTMQKLGMNLAFDESKADFSNLSSNGRLYISDIVHKAFINVDEHGTQAAAATAVLISTTGEEIVPNSQMSIDKPFVYMIVDNETKQILFLGHLMKP